MSTSQDRREYPPEGSDKNRSVSFGYTPTEQERQVFSEAGRRMIMLHVGGILVGCISGVVGGRRLGIPFRSIRGMVFVAGGVVLGEMTGRRLGDHQSGKILQAGLASNSTLRMMLESSDIGFSLLNLYRANTIKPKLDASGEFGFHITTPSPLLVEQILLQQQAEDATNRTLSVLETTTESGASTNSGDVAASTWDKIRRQHDHSVMTTWDRLRMQNNGRGPAASQALQTADTPPEQ
ncbi:hypothetical protein BASA60_008362 [Batrachochytrium salamandrivorans]|nr:hypothetical protein BASA60_008362 [Batrachochytrium salamandrivorans]